MLCLEEQCWKSQYRPRVVRLHEVVAVAADLEVEKGLAGAVVEDLMVGLGVVEQDSPVLEQVM